VSCDRRQACGHGGAQRPAVQRAGSALIDPLTRLPNAVPVRQFREEISRHLRAAAAQHIDWTVNDFSSERVHATRPATASCVSCAIFRRS